MVKSKYHFIFSAGMTMRAFFLRHKTFAVVAAVFILAVSVRLLVLHFFTIHQAEVSVYSPFVFPDSHNFIAYASNLVQHGIYADASGLLAWRTPGYSLLLASVMRLFGDDILLWRMVNIILAGFNAVLVWSIGRRLWGSLAGVIAGILLACYPFLAYLDTLILADTLGVFSILLCVRLLIEAVSSGRGVWAAACGLSCAFATMTKASFGGLVVLFALYLLICWWGRLRFRALVLFFLLLLSFAAGMTPWVVRNQAALKTFVPLSTMGGFTLWECTGPSADGGANHGKVEFPENWRTMMDKIATGNRFDESGKSYEVQADIYLKGLCREVMLSDVSRTALLSLRKFARTWNPVPNWSGAAGWKYGLAMAGYYVPVMLLAFVGLIMLRRNWREVYILLLPALYLAAVHSIFMGSIRYRLPAVAALSVLAAGSLACLYRMYKGRKKNI